MRAALGLKARTGRAALVAVGGDEGAPELLERSQIPLLPEGAFAPYHAAAEMEPPDGRRHVKRSITTANRLAGHGIAKTARRLVEAGHDVRACGVLVGPPLPPWTVDEIFAVHVRMHQAEGVMFREALVAGARACDLEMTTLPHASALDDAARLLKIGRDRLDERLAALGRAAGPPWGKDQKEAAAAALVALRNVMRGRKK
jgi:hypothetical protein